MGASGLMDGCADGKQTGTKGLGWCTTTLPVSVILGPPLGTAVAVDWYKWISILMKCLQESWNKTCLFYDAWFMQLSWCLSQALDTESWKVYRCHQEPRQQENQGGQHCPCGAGPPVVTGSWRNATHPSPGIPSAAPGPVSTLAYVSSRRCQGMLPNCCLCPLQGLFIPSHGHQNTLGVGETFPS